MLEAEIEVATMAIFMVHEFRTPATNDDKFDSNANALNRFLSLFHSRNGGPDEDIELRPGELLGPISIVNRPDAGLPRMPSPPLFIGKVRTDTRGRLSSYCFVFPSRDSVQSRAAMFLAS
jgi:hypothetical protein